MINSKTMEKLEHAEELFKKLEEIWKFDDEYCLLPFKSAQKLCDELNEFSMNSLNINVPKSQDEFFSLEANRRLNGERYNLEQKLKGKSYSFDEMLKILSVPLEDIDALKPWLEENMDKTNESLERLFYNGNIETDEVLLNLDISDNRMKSEKIAEKYIKKYHNILGKFLQNLTNVEDFFENIKATSTIVNCSYFYNNQLAVSIPSICFSTKNRGLQVREKALIDTYGHEAMGHGLNEIVTKSSDLPYIFKYRNSLTVSTRESLAQFYENVLFDELHKSPQTQKELGIESIFDDMYKYARDERQVKEYRQKLLHYFIVVNADKSLGKHDDPKTIKKKIDIINEVAVNKKTILIFMDRNMHNFDSLGNINYNLVSELRYCARPVSRALEEFKKRGIPYEEGENRKIINSTFLKGFWTPAGFVDNARLKAEEISMSRENKLNGNLGV
jgi:hypothetical protein